MIWVSILILCGERGEDVSQSVFYVTKAAALVILILLSKWLDRRCLNEHTKTQ